jgi:hypothetical protein
MALGCSMRGACRSILSASVNWRIQGRSLIRGMYSTIRSKGDSMTDFVTMRFGSVDRVYTYKYICMFARMY